MHSVQAIILAAGRSSRFTGPTSKLLAPIANLPMIMRPINACRNLDIPTTLVVGHEKERVIDTVRIYAPEVSYVEQNEQRGTGHALLCSRPAWKASTLLVLNGDMPLVNSELIKQLIEHHVTQAHCITFVTCIYAQEKSSYGRIVQTESSISIVEARHFTKSAYDYPLINAGIYLINRHFLESVQTELLQSNRPEVYITDLIGIASIHKQSVGYIITPFYVVQGVNTVAELEQVERYLLCQENKNIKTI
ncbi:hypothetical protein J120_02740 [candidate division TM6 bacterium JCVI TM6SC1]|uniref:MobA-like NTP transferase domain-containing protein n=1 Tax=candidate division TM6 bacterium JCVI TM6SC1 TaxID=1306947 RepID=A0A0D2I241_9BACT|nr:hypothetical protein J120_02740 [candidate division TM6 bacterium JCVI TM6SC1]